MLETDPVVDEFAWTETSAKHVKSSQQMYGLPLSVNLYYEI